MNWFGILGTGFQSLVGFWIPGPRILDSKSENFPDSGMRIPLHGPTYALLIKSEVTMAEYRPSLFFFAFLWTEVDKNAKKDLDVIQPS